MLANIAKQNPNAMIVVAHRASASYFKHMGVDSKQIYTLDAVMNGHAFHGRTIHGPVLLDDFDSMIGELLHSPTCRAFVISATGTAL